MGIIGLILTFLIVLSGIGYAFFGMPSSSLTVTRDSEAPNNEGGLALYEGLKGKGEEIKTEEESVQEEIALLEESLDANVPEKQEQAEKSAPEASSKQSIKDRLMATGFTRGGKARAIDTIVLHSSYNSLGGDPYSVEKMVSIYESYGVSAHYLIDRNGMVYRLVRDQDVAYHAGVSTMPDGRKSVNDFSLGIEMMNTEEGNFTRDQYEAVQTLVETLKKKYPIKSIVGHGEIAPGRKTDPWNFDWKKLK